MKLKDSFVFVLLVIGIGAAMGGFALVSRGLTYGWGIVAVAVPLLFIVARSMRLKQTGTTAPGGVDVKNEEPSAGT